MVAKKNIISQEGYEKIIAELSQIKDVQIPDTLEVLKDARSQGDLSENSDYHAAKEKLALLQRRVSELEDLTENVEIIKNNDKGTDNIVRYGSKVELEIEGDKSFFVNIVGTGEVSVLDDFNISFDSPLGVLIEGKKKGDTVELKLATATKKVSILSVS